MSSCEFSFALFVFWGAYLATFVCVSDWLETSTAYCTLDPVLAEIVSNQPQHVSITEHWTT